MQKIIAKIHLGNIRRNAETFVALTGKKLCAVVKANAYGHGAEEVVNALEGVADSFAVALIDEGIAIRTSACGKDVLVFTPPINEDEAVALADNGFVATVPDFWTAKLLARVCRRRQIPLKVHLKVNTGMNRYGMNASMLGKVCKFLQTQPLIRVESLYTHLCECEDERAEAQYDLFLQMRAVARRYFPEITTHLGGTSAAILKKKFDMDTLRIGLGLYGYLPNATAATLHLRENIPLQKGMTVYAVTTSSRRFSFGGAGYGKAFSSEQAVSIRRLSVCRFGYADGFLRHKANGVCGVENHANALCMDVCIRKDNARRGKIQPIMTDADETAKATDTISYEVLCAATRRAEFVYDND